MFLVVVEKFYQAQTSNFSHIFVIKTEPEPSYKLTNGVFRKRLKILILVIVTQVIPKKKLKCKIKNYFD